MPLFVAISRLTDVKALIKSIRKANDAKSAGIKISPKPIIENVCCATGSVMTLAKSLGKMNFIGFSILVATVTITSEPNTKKQS